MSEHQHEWISMGRIDNHVSFPTVTEGVKHLVAHYVKCGYCMQMGFRRPGSKVVYTWSKESAA